MNFKKHLFIGLNIFLWLYPLQGYEVFIFRPYEEKKPLFKEKKLYVHGEFFAQLLFSSTFPSYNDLSGKDDRWNFGFQNRVFLTESSSLLAQLVTHDDGQKRTKFDWHFSFRQKLLDNIVLIIGHDSNHDSDYQSPKFINRNYIGFGLPVESETFYIELFTWFFHHTNQRGHLDYSGNKLRQEFGLRVGAWQDRKIGLHFQLFFQTEQEFSLGQAVLADLIIRIKLYKSLEISIGTGLYQDIKESRLGNKNRFSKFIWGIAAPF